MKETKNTNNENNPEENGTRQNRKKNDLKKQLVSGGVYIALAATVVAVTVSTITATFSGLSNEKVTGDKTLYHTQKDNTGKNDKSGTNIPENPNVGNNLSAGDLTLDTPVSDVGKGVDATVTESGKTKNDVPAKKQDAPPKNDTPEDAVITENKPEAGTSEDKTAPRSEEPAEATFEIGYDGYIKPCSGFINKEYSVEMPVYSATMYDYRTHSGIDILSDPGTLVKAVSNGTIKEVYTDYLYGTTVVIEHANGVESVYQGLSPELPAETVAGRTVMTGEAIAGIGNSALCESAEASHLHFEMRKDGVSVDPCDYIEF